MSFPLPDDILQSPHVAFKQMMHEVKLHQNGAVSRQMEAGGLNYKLNYGVTVPLLKNIASAYKKDNALATQLWNSGIREGILLSSFVYDPTNISTEHASNISKDINNIELIEQFALNLFVFLPNLDEFIGVLLAGEDHQQLLAFYSMSWGLKRKILSETYHSQALQLIEKTIDTKPEPVLKGLNVAMQSLLFVSPQLADQIFALAERMKNSAIETVKSAGKEFLWLHRD